MFYTVKISKKHLFFCLLIIAIICTAFSDRHEKSVPVFISADERCLIIDAGHGGVDGGAIGITGMKESDINLDIALKLEAIAALYGEKTLMTRRDDTSVSDSVNYSEHDDLVCRTELANSTENAVLVSIHQNCYPTSQPSGAQVLYSKTSGSEMLGKIIHKNIIDNLEPGNRRVAEPASDKLYITSNASCPAVLIECGFVSNFSDLDKLTDDAYQIQLAAVIFSSYLNFIYNC